MFPWSSPQAYAVQPQRTFILKWIRQDTFAPFTLIGTQSHKTDFVKGNINISGEQKFTGNTFSHCLLWRTAQWCVNAFHTPLSPLASPFWMIFTCCPYMSGKRKGMFTLLLLCQITIYQYTNKVIAGWGAVAQAAVPTMNELERPRGPGFESDPRSFPDPTPHLQLISCHKPSLHTRGKKPKIKSLKNHWRQHDCKAPFWILHYFGWKHWAITITSVINKQTNK